MIPGPASDTHVQWSPSAQHPSFQSSRVSIEMALVALEGGGEYRGALGTLKEHELQSLLDLIDEQVAARRAFAAEADERFLDRIHDHLTGGL